MIWARDYKITDLTEKMHSYMGTHLGIEFLELGADYLSGKMPVDDKTKTPFGLLHGGASCVLAETLGSCASYLCLNPDEQAAVGLEINANHIKSARDGFVTGVAKAIHIGGSIHVWEIRISNEQNELVCISRLTIKVLNKKH